MKGVTSAILKENLKCSSIGIARIFSVKALVMLVIVLSTVLPIIVISEDGSDRDGEDLHRYLHPGDVRTSSWGDVTDWDRLDEIPVEEGSEDEGADTLLTVMVLALSVLNIAICHTYVFSKNMGRGRLSILRHMGVPVGRVLKGNIISVVVLYSIISVLDMVFLSMLNGMVSSLFIGVIIAGLVSSAVVLSLYLLGVTVPTSVRILGKRFMVPMMVLTFLVGIGILLSRTIVDPMFDTLGLDIPVLKAILTGFSPVHFIGAVAGWVTGGDPVRITDLSWTVPAALLIIAGIIFTGRIKGGELRSPILSVH